VIHGTGGGLERTANAVLTITATITQSATTTTGGLMETLQQNSLILIGALALLVIVLAALAMRGRSQHVRGHVSQAIVITSKDKILRKPLRIYLNARITWVWA
jgi:site-specific recombinase